MSQTTDLERFHQFTSACLTHGERQLSPEEALVRFRMEMPDGVEFSESVAAIHRALSQADRGEGIPLEDAMRRLREEFQLPEVTVTRVTYDIIVTPEAYGDLQSMIAWVEERSPEGAAKLLVSFERQLENLKTSPESHSYAPEKEIVGRPIRQMFFRTKQGHRRRALFEIRGRQVVVLHVRGAHQDLLDVDTLRHD